jgi:flagellar motor switch protein FliM
MSTNEQAVEKALGDMMKPKLPSVKSFAPPDQRSVRELVEEIEDALGLVEARVKSLKVRLDEFYRLQNEFYVGDKS